MQLLVGTDPEVFLRQEGQLVSAFGLVEGTKFKPHLVDNGAVQVDGMALEFNIDPADSLDSWMFNIKSVMAQLGGMVDGELIASPVAEFGAEYIAAQPFEATELGCDPDFNAWTGQENPKPDENLPFRTGAGHVHIGFTDGVDASDPNHFELCCKIAKQLDLYLGIPSVLMDDCTKRREMYGQAGAFRPKSYGLEYRVLSNFWLQSEEYTAWVFNTVHKALNSYMNNGPSFELYTDLEEVINTSDTAQAVLIAQQQGIEVIYD
jgi:hypothetical protein